MRIGREASAAGNYLWQRAKGGVCPHPSQSPPASRKNAKFGGNPGVSRGNPGPESVSIRLM